MTSPGTPSNLRVLHPITIFASRLVISSGNSTNPSDIQIRSFLAESSSLMESGTSWPMTTPSVSIILMVISSERWRKPLEISTNTCS